MNDDDDDDDDHHDDDKAVLEESTNCTLPTILLSMSTVKVKGQGQISSKFSHF